VAENAQPAEASDVTITHAHEEATRVDSNWDWEAGEKKIPVAEWRDRFQWVEEPYASPDGETVAAIVNVEEGEFSVCANGEAWENHFDKIWHLRFTLDGRAAALVSEGGEWTVAVDGRPWPVTFGELVTDMVFGPDGRSIAALAKEKDGWKIVVDGRVWRNTFDMAFTPVFAPAGGAVAVRMERKGRYGFALNDRLLDIAAEAAWDPQFSADGRHLLLRFVESGVYHRRVLPVSAISG